MLTYDHVYPIERVIQGQYVARFKAEKWNNLQLP